MLHQMPPEIAVPGVQLDFFLSPSCQQQIEWSGKIQEAAGARGGWSHEAHVYNS